MTTDPDWQRLARFVRAQRNDLDLAQADLKARGGPGVTTVNKIETARATSYRSYKLRALEVALGWLPGSVEAVLAGGSPRLRSGRTLDVGLVLPDNAREPSDLREVANRLEAAARELDHARAIISRMDESEQRFGPDHGK